MREGVREDGEWFKRQRTAYAACAEDAVRRIKAVVFVVIQAEDGIRDSVASHGLGDVYKWQHLLCELRQMYGYNRYGHSG